MNFWLVKSEPETYSFEELRRHGTDYWDGVRNYQARNNLRAMKKGDPVLFYHSGKIRAAVGLCTVARESYQDPTTDDERWLAVDLKAGKPLGRPVPLVEIKKTPGLGKMLLLRNSRLSVMPVAAKEYEIILSLSKQPAPDGTAS